MRGVRAILTKQFYPVKLFIFELVISKKLGGERGIRTLDGLLTHTPLAGERLQPLGHLSTRQNDTHNNQRVQPLNSLFFNFFKNLQAQSSYKKDEGRHLAFHSARCTQGKISPSPSSKFFRKLLSIKL